MLQVDISFSLPRDPKNKIVKEQEKPKWLWIAFSTSF